MGVWEYGVWGEKTHPNPELTTLIFILTNLIVGIKVSHSHTPILYLIP